MHRNSLRKYVNIRVFLRPEQFPLMEERLAGPWSAPPARGPPRRTARPAVAPGRSAAALLVRRRPPPLPSPQGEAGESWVLLLLQPRRVARSPPAAASAAGSCSAPPGSPARPIAGPPRGQVAELVAVPLERTRRG